MACLSELTVSGCSGGCRVPHAGKARRFRVKTHHGIVLIAAPKKGHPVSHQRRVPSLQNRRYQASAASSACCSASCRSHTPSSDACCCATARAALLQLSSLISILVSRYVRRGYFLRDHCTLVTICAHRVWLSTDYLGNGDADVCGTPRRRRYCMQALQAPS